MVVSSLSEQRLKALRLDQVTLCAQAVVKQEPRHEARHFSHNHRSRYFGGRRFGRTE